MTTAHGVADFQDAQRSRRPVATLGLAHKTRLYQVNMTTLTRTAGLLVLQCPGDAAGTTRDGGLGRLRRRAHPRRPPKCRRAVQAVKQVERMVMRMIGQDRAKQD